MFWNRLGSQKWVQTGADNASSGVRKTGSSEDWDMDVLSEDQMGNGVQRIRLFIVREDSQLIIFQRLSLSSFYHVLSVALKAVVPARSISAELCG